jgi:hypothetical protein
MMSNVFSLPIFLALVAAFGWLATRVRGKWGSLVLVGLLSIGLALGFAIQLSDTLQLVAPASTSKPSDQIIGVTAQAGRNEEFASFCEGCHSDLNKQPIASNAVSLSGDVSLVFMPLEISSDPSAIDAQEIVAYARWLGPDLHVATSAWSEADFVNIFRSGKDPQGHEITRGMPWRDISVFATDDDLKAYYLYLHSSSPSDKTSH